MRVIVNRSFNKLEPQISVDQFWIENRCGFPRNSNKLSFKNILKTQVATLLMIISKTCR